jgi:uncharacterized membrane protein YbhN (UPF0104 family)
MGWYLYATFEKQGQGFLSIYQLIVSNLTAQNIVILIIVLSLTFLNWSAEALKWQTLAKRVERLTFWEAFAGVFAGLAMGFVMPNNIGDATGRVMSLKSKERLTSIGAALVSNGLQFYVSLLFGTLGWAYFLFKQPSLQIWYNFILLVLLISTLFFGLFVLYSRQKAANYLVRFRLFRKIIPYIGIIAQYRRSEIGKAFGWAVLRYAMFSVQFGLLLAIFQIQLPLIDALMSIFLVFFSKTLIPAINLLGDLGIREASSLCVFGFYGVTPANVIATTLTLWTINILAPTIVGAFYLWKIKLSTQ